MNEKNKRINKIKHSENAITMVGLVIVIGIIIIVMVIFLKFGINKVFSGTQKRVDEINREINDEPQKVYDNTLKDLEVDKYLNK